MRRNNKDSQMNKFGSLRIDLYCTFDILMANGRLFDDKDGKFTCTANEGRSVVDYFLLSSPVFKHVSYFTVGGEDFSDHFPVRCNMSFRSQRRVNNDTKLPDWTYTTFKWNETHTDSFVEKLTSLYAAFSTAVTENNVIHKLSEFTSIFRQAL